MTRRALLLAPFSLQASRGVHLQGVLQPDNQSGDGYYHLCGEKGCDYTDTLAVSVHPAGRFAKDLWNMAHRRVQVSIFPA